jgi:hypothetical protein
MVGQEVEVEVEVEIEIEIEIARQCEASDGYRSLSLENATSNGVKKNITGKRSGHAGPARVRNQLTCAQRSVKLARWELRNLVREAVMRCVHDLQTHA